MTCRGERSLISTRIRHCEWHGHASVFTGCSNGHGKKNAPENRGVSIRNLGDTLKVGADGQEFFAAMFAGF
jgi:hypothetical protein